MWSQKDFFLPTHRGDLPQVPSCGRCNAEKSKLEHYLTTVLPFAGQHADAVTNLSNMVPPRLANNEKLHGSLSQNASSVWTETRSGLHARSIALPFESERLVELCGYIVRGLLFYHWGTRLTAEHYWEVVLLTSAGRKMFDEFMQMRAKDRVSRDLGNGTFLYEGIQGFDNDSISAWRFSVYGGLKLTGVLGEESVHMVALTGPKRVLDSVDPHANMRVPG